MTEKDMEVSNNVLSYWSKVISNLRMISLLAVMVLFQSCDSSKNKNDHKESITLKTPELNNDDSIDLISQGIDSLVAKSFIDEANRITAQVSKDWANLIHIKEIESDSTNIFIITTPEPSEWYFIVWTYEWDEIYLWVWIWLDWKYIWILKLNGINSKESKDTEEKINKIGSILKDIKVIVPKNFKIEPTT